jgi:hypothetical protein
MPSALRISAGRTICDLELTVVVGMVAGCCFADE